MRRRIALLATIASVVTLFGITGTTTSPVAAVTTPASPVFINEIHYDNAGTDEGEFVEVAAPLCADLSNWSLAFYNGANGQQYSSASLGGAPTDVGGGFGVLTVFQAGIQNGSPDGIALVDNAGTVIQFLSYEGEFSATNGPATGLVSTDIGVSQSGSDPIGNTLSLSGSGGTAADFSWNAPAPGTPGALNTGQVLEVASNPCPAPATFVINEVDYDQPSTDTAEFVEIKNVSDEVQTLGGLQLAFVNGANDTEYRTVILAAVEVAAGDYYVVCGNSGLVANCDVELPIAQDLIQNGAPDALALREGGPGGTIVDAVSYEGVVPGFSEGASAPTDSGEARMSISRCPDGADTNDNSADFQYVASTPGTANSCDVGGPEDPPMVFIHQVQGNGSTVAITSAVTVEAIVIGLFENNDALDGFFIQEEYSDADGDPTTSEGIYVFCRPCSNATGIAVGDEVKVIGDPTDFFGMSQLEARDAGDVTIVSTANPLPAATVLALPAPGSTLAEDTFEAVEGMLVEFSTKLVVSEYFQSARFGQLVLTADERPYQFTHSNPPGVPGYEAFLADLATRRIILDDLDNNQNEPIENGPNPDEPYFHPIPGLSTTNYYRGGDSITGLTGVMHWSFAGASGTDAWRIRPVPGAFDYTFEPENPRPAQPEDVGGSLKVASFNVLNYFTTIDETSSNSSGPCGPSGTLDCRGADSVEELERQTAKIVAALAEIDADVVGVIEIENNASASLQGLVDALNVSVGAGAYTFVDTGTIGTDAIKVGLIYKPAAVSEFGPFAILDSTVDPTFLDDKNRPVLIQTFEENATGERFTVAVNHLKSKGSACDDVGDPNAGDGQGNCNGTRTAATAALANYLATDPTGSGDPDFLIVGDLNAYAMEDPITTLKNAGYTDLLADYGGTTAYTYLFDGQLGYLDTALANRCMAGQVTGVTAWHINADEDPLFDYNDDVRTTGEASFERKSGALPLYAPDAFRSSDHDPVIVGLELAKAGNGVACAVLGDNAPGTGLDQDIFRFQGQRNEYVTIRIEALDGSAERALLSVVGALFLQVNGSELPNELSGRLRFSGTYTIILSELFGFQAFEGPYILTVESSGNAAATLEATSSVE